MPRRHLAPFHITPNPEPDLTLREEEVLTEICAGHTYKGVGANLCISKKTVEKHAQQLFQKFNIHSSLLLAFYCHANNIRPNPYSTTK